MHHYRIHMINSDFESSEEGAYASLQAAIEAALRSASEVARDLIAKGEANSAIEIRIEENDQVIARRVLAYSISPLAVGE
jgi:hypothetical protein